METFVASPETTNVKLQWHKDSSAWVSTHDLQQWQQGHLPTVSAKGNVLILELECVDTIYRKHGTHVHDLSAA